MRIDQTAGTGGIGWIHASFVNGQYQARMTGQRKRACNAWSKGILDFQMHCRIMLLVMNKRTLLAGGLLLGLLLGPQRLFAEPTVTVPDRTAIAIEALSRLKDVDLESNPALKAAVMKVLDSTRGTPNFVKIVQD